jgi:hypothetical protein
MNKLASLLLFAGGAAFALAARRGSRGADKPVADETTPTPPPSAATWQGAPDITPAPSATPGL